MKRLTGALLALMMIFSLAIADTITIPEGLTTIPEEMFEGSKSVKDVVVPDTVTAIGSKAFANTGLLTIVVHSNVTLIADDAFQGCPAKLVAYVNTGSYAESYFKSKGISTQPATMVDAFRKYKCTKTAWTSVDSIFYRRVKNTSTQCVATVYDITSGLSFNVRRVGGDNHADIETMTTADTATMCKMLGVSRVSQINSQDHYGRRPCLLLVSGRLIACSMYAVPHDGGRPSDEKLLSNGMSGKIFCLHFYGSKTSSTNRVDTAHQNAVNTAYNWWNSKYGN